MTFPAHWPTELVERLRFQRRLTRHDLPRVPNGHCRWCGGPVKAPRRCWCCDECVEQYLILSTIPTGAVYKRDKGICARCGIDAEEVRELMRDCKRATRNYRHDYHDLYLPLKAQWGPWGLDSSRVLWEADHIIPVVEGGGCCGLDNYQTLCLPCHKLDTAALAARLASKRREMSHNSGAGREEG